MGNAACRKKLILEVAERLLAHYGPSKTTVADIAREADVGVGTVYLEFSSKDAILEALATERHERVLEAMKRAASGPGTRAERLGKMFEARVETQVALCKGGNHASELVQCSSPAMRACQQRFLANQRALVAAFLGAAADEGAFAAADVEAVSGALLRCYASFNPPWVLERAESELKAELEAMHRLVLQGLLRR